MTPIPLGILSQVFKFLAGKNDTSFNILDNYADFSSNVKSIAIQSDGKIVVVGDFTSFNGTTVNSIARLNPDGSLDTAFASNIGTAANNMIESVAIQSDGKIVIGGWFSSFNGTSVGRLVRLNSDGTRDTAFTTNAGTGALGTVYQLAIQSDGKIVIGGSFTSFNGTTVGRLARLNSDGTLDTAFTTNTGTGVNSNVNSVAIQSDGRIVLGGSFTSFNGTTVNRIARLNSDGTRDTAFTTNTGTGVNSTLNSIAIQSDGKIVLGGGFSTFNGATVNRLVRLNSDGTRDTAFTTNAGTGPNSTVNSIAIQSDGKIVIGGGFLAFNGTTAIRIARLNSSGTLDTAFASNTGTGAGSTVLSIAIQSDGRIVLGGGFTSFNNANLDYIIRLNSDGTTNHWQAIYGANGTVFSIAIQSDGKIVIGGSFTSFNGTSATRIARLNSSGTLDTAFASNIGTGANSTVNSIAIQSDGKIVIGGTFSTFNGATANRILRLNSDGTLDTAFASNIGTGATADVNSIAIQSDGKIVLGGIFPSINGTTAPRIARLNSDGTRDTAFTTNTGTGFNSTVSSIAIQSDGKIVVGGWFSTFNGVTVNRLVRLNSDGTRDTAFTTNAGTGPSSIVASVAIQSDDKIVLGGMFLSFNGTTANRIARLNSDGTFDTEFASNTGIGANADVNSIAIQSDGKIIIGGIFRIFNGTTVNRIARLNSDGTFDTEFASNTGTGVNSTVNSIAIQSDGKIVLGGSFIVFNDAIRHRFARLIN